MSNYVKATNFAAKDSLLTTDPLKIVKGTELDNEYNAIASAVSSKADTNSPTLTGTPLAPTAASGTNTNQIATTAFVTAATGNATNIAGGAANRVVYQTALDTTGFAPAPTTSGTYLGWTGSDFAWSTVSASTSAALTMNNSGAGDSSGATFNGSLAKTISYNTIGAPSTSGTGATGTWGISITGSSGSTSYATSAGSASTATTATTAGGLTGSPAITVSSVTSSGNIQAYSGTSYAALQPAAVSLYNGASGMFCDGSSFGWQFNSVMRGQLTSSGTNYNTTGTYAAFSDVRIKENIVQAPKYLDKLCALNVVNFNYIDNPNKMLGFVAQEVEQVMPGLVEVVGNKNYPDIPDLKGVKTSILIPMLVQAVQELKAEIDALKNG